MHLLDIEGDGRYLITRSDLTHVWNNVHNRTVAMGRASYWLTRDQAHMPTGTLLIAKRTCFIVNTLPSAF